jgi:hypothetical protein
MRIKGTGEGLLDGRYIILFRKRLARMPAGKI